MQIVPMAGLRPLKAMPETRFGATFFSRGYADMPPQRQSKPLLTQQEKTMRLVLALLGVSVIAHMTEIKRQWTLQRQTEGQKNKIQRLTNYVAADKGRIEFLNRQLASQEPEEIQRLRAINRAAPATGKITIYDNGAEVGHGSGILFSDLSGRLLVLTNAHVTQHSTPFIPAPLVDTPVKNQFKIQFFGQDKSIELEPYITPASAQAFSPSLYGLDLSVLQLKSAESLPSGIQPILPRTEPSYVGMSVIAIGSPSDLQDSVSTGIVSNTKRTLDSGRGIQITAAIGPGSSGGAVVDMTGKLAGVSSQLYIHPPFNGLMIPADEVWLWLQSIGINVMTPDEQQSRSKELAEMKVLNQRMKAPQWLMMTWFSELQNFIRPNPFEFDSLDKENP